MRKRFERWDRRWWWLVSILMTVGFVVMGADRLVIAIFAFAAGLEFAKRFPPKAKQTVGKRRSVQL